MSFSEQATPLPTEFIHIHVLHIVCKLRYCTCVHVIVDCVVCMYMYICIAYVCTYAYNIVHVCVYMCICIYILCTYMYVIMYMCSCTKYYVCSCTIICVCAYCNMPKSMQTGQTSWQASTVHWLYTAACIQPLCCHHIRLLLWHDTRADRNTRT